MVQDSNLACFATVLKCGDFALASKELGRTTASVKKAFVAYERSIGFPLVEANKFRQTIATRLALDILRDHFGDFDLLLDEMTSLVNQHLVTFRRIHGNVYEVDISKFTGLTSNLAGGCIETKFARTRVVTPPERNGEWTTEEEFRGFLAEFGASNEGMHQKETLTSLQGMHLYVFKQISGKKYRASRKQLTREQYESAELRLAEEATALKLRLPELPGITAGHNRYLVPTIEWAERPDREDDREIMDEALEFYQSVVTKHSNARPDELARAYNSLAWYSALYDKWEDMLAYAEKSVATLEGGEKKIGREYGAGLQYRGFASLQLGKIESASSDLDTVIGMSASSGVLHKTRIRALISKMILLWSTDASEGRTKDCSKKIRSLINKVSEVVDRSIVYLRQCPQEEQDWYDLALRRFMHGRVDIQPPFVAEQKRGGLESRLRRTVPDEYQRIINRIARLGPERLPSDDLRQLREWLADREGDRKLVELQQHFQQAASKLIPGMEPDELVTLAHLQEFFSKWSAACQKGDHPYRDEKLPPHFMDDEAKESFVELVRLFRNAGGTVKYDGEPCVLRLYRKGRMKHKGFMVRVRREGGARKEPWQKLALPSLTFEKKD